MRDQGKELIGKRKKTNIRFWSVLVGLAIILIFVNIFIFAIYEILNNLPTL